MHKFERRALTFLLALIMSFSLCLPGAAYDAEATQPKAEALNTLGLLKGTDRGLELEKSMTRLEALIMTIRLTGNEWTAVYGEWSHPFTDAPTWEKAAEYIGYGYEKGLIAGISATELAPNTPASAQMFATLLLRALGYTDGEKTVWDNWTALLADAGLAVPDNSKPFLRGDMADLCWAALDVQVKGTDKTLAQTLVDSQYITDLALSVAQVQAGKSVSADSSLADIAGAVYAGLDDVLGPGSLVMDTITAENMTRYLGTDKLSIAEGIAIEPMFSAHAHSVCILRLKSGENVEKAKELIRSSVNPNKWICVSVDPENIRVDSIGNMICLVMDNADPDGIINNFKALEKIQPDKNGMMQVGSLYMEAGRETNEAYIQRFAQKLVSVRGEYIPHNNVYYAVVPDKTYYVRDKVSAWFDHDAITEILARNLPGWTEIDLTNALTAEDYYNTDPHWRQEKLSAVCDAMAKTMGFQRKEALTLHSSVDFIGSYRRQVSNLSGETLNWYTGASIDAAQVKNYQDGAAAEIYDADKLSGNNPYDFFLSGATPLQVIENPKAAGQKELVIFRDSYASALAPLLVESYAKITLVDLRYMASSLLPQYVDMSQADVLFLYSDNLVNNLLLLK